MKTTISIPHELFESAEALACRLGISRNELYSRAIARLVDEHADASVIEALDRIHGDRPKASLLGPVSEALQSASLDEDDWE